MYVYMVKIYIIMYTHTHTLFGFAPVGIKLKLKKFKIGWTKSEPNTLGFSLDSNNIFFFVYFLLSSNHIFSC